MAILDKPVSAQVPAPTQATLEKWYDVQQKLAKLRAQEAIMRKEIFQGAFPNPTEGAANKMDLGDGFILQATHSITRSIDKSALVTAKIGLEEAGIPVDDLIEYKPSLKKAAWNKLTDENKHKFAIVLVEKPGSPTLAIKKPKREV